MMISPISLAQTNSRIRPVSLPRDLPQLQRLLRDVFHFSLDADGRQALNTMNQNRWFLGAANMGQTIHAGYVWEHNGTLIGNISLIPTKTDGRVVIANVAVAPDQRRQGVARHLLETALNHLADRRTEIVTLQVDVDNDGARRLYETFGFNAIGTTTYWQAAPGAYWELATEQISHSWQRNAPSALDIRPLHPSEWRNAYQIDIASNPLDLNWPNIIHPETYRAKFFQQISDFLNGRQSETWSAKMDGELVGIASIWSEWGRPHRLSVRVLPKHPQAEKLNRALFAKLLRRLLYLRRRDVTCEHRDDDVLMDSLLRAAGFQDKRRLITMKLTI